MLGNSVGAGWCESDKEEENERKKNNERAQHAPSGHFMNENIKYSAVEMRRNWLNNLLLMS